MKLFKKLLAVTLALGIVVGAGVTTGEAATVKAAGQENLKSVFSIDAGRKYFSKDQLKQIISKAHANGYTDVQILLGNDALRFVLDDMSMDVEGVQYSSEDVVDAIKKGNNLYHNDPNGNVLTESEMNEILAHAEKLNIGIIPVINGPGHMDGILNAMKELGIKNPEYSYGGKTSTRTIDLNNETAMAFNKALLNKYISYFSGKCEIFNFGCDEYANDIDSSAEGYYNGWSRLQGTGDYPKFVKYVNDVAGMVENAGMTPLCFNDGIYYNNDDQFGTFDKDIIISYWTAGWWEFYVAKPSYLASKGHKILNTNDSWYWVLGNIDGKIDENSVPYAYNDTVKKIQEKKFTELAGKDQDAKIIGSMQAVWCDVPSVEHDMDRILGLMDMFSEKHSNYLIRPADYTKVDEAIAKIPSDLSVYTEETVNALNAAKDAVVRNKRVTEQAVVNGYAKEIEAAISGLTYKKADYSKVDEAIAKADKLNKVDYKDFSKVEAAIKAVKRDLDITKQAEVDAMAKAVEDAISALEKKASVSNGNTNSGNTTGGTSDTIKTGDTTNMTLWFMMLVVSAGLAGILYTRKRKENR